MSFSKLKTLNKLFLFMQNRGSPVNRIPIMAKDVLDLFRLYQLVVEKGGLVEIRAPWNDVAVPTMDHSLW